MEKEIKRDPPLAAAPDLEALLARCRSRGIIEWYRIEPGHVVMSRLGANYRIAGRHACGLLLRMLRERPPAADGRG